MESARCAVEASRLRANKPVSSLTMNTMRAPKLALAIDKDPRDPGLIGLAEDGRGVEPTRPASGNDAS
jgi:hypothetical protein